MPALYSPPRLNAIAVNNLEEHRPDRSLPRGMRPHVDNRVELVFCDRRDREAVASFESHHVLELRRGAHLVQRNYPVEFLLRLDVDDHVPEGLVWSAARIGMI